MPFVFPFGEGTHFLGNDPIEIYPFVVRVDTVYVKASEALRSKIMHIIKTLGVCQAQQTQDLKQKLRHGGPRGTTSDSELDLDKRKRLRVRLRHNANAN